MEILTPAEANVALAISYLDENGLLDWAQTYAREHSEIRSDSSLFELLWINRKRKDQLASVKKLLENFVTEVQPAFDLRSEASEQTAQALFVARLQEYVDEKCTPWEMCRMVDPIEQLYDFPSWLGDMYNACDWIEPDTKPVACRHLEHAIRRHLNDA